MFLKSLKMTNIRSYVNEEISFPSGSMLLAGDIGSGKSTILLAIEFALFGTDRSSLSGSDLLRHGKNNGSVELEFEMNGKNIIIRRALKRKANIAQDSGKLIINGSVSDYSPIELKERIMDMFGYSRELQKKNAPIFRYTVYTPQEEMKHIMFEPESRLNILRKVFGIDRYGTIKSNNDMLLAEMRAMRREYEAYAKGLDEKIMEKESRGNLFRDMEKILEKQSIIAESERENYNKKSAGFGKIKEKMNEIRLAKDMAKKLSIDIEKRKNIVSAIEKSIEEAKKNIKEYEKISLPEKPERNEKEILNNLFALETAKTGAAKEQTILQKDKTSMEKILNRGVCDVCFQPVANRERFEGIIRKKSSRLEEIDNDIFLIERQIAESKASQEKWRAYSIALEKYSFAKKNIENSSRMIEKYEEDKKSAETEIENAEKEANKLKFLIDSAQKIEAEYKMLEREANEALQKMLAEEKEKSRLEQQRNDVKSEIKRMEEEIGKKIDFRKKSERIGILTNWIDSLFIPLMDSMERHVLLSVQQEFDSLLRKWLEIIIGDALNVRIDEGFSPLIEQNGFATSYENLSGGEKTAVALAYRLALNKVINSMIDTIKTNDLLILDEPTDGFSTDQLDRLRDVINELNLRQIIIVSHEQKIDTFVDNVIRIYKENHVSRICA